ncbi:MAG TPA: peptidylprolyl isomerase [Candidatus Eisenbacteria bacterium]|nr:peptidylprolyl isomerase [Candidatus Eisenbacteria bacterium]
MFGSRFAFAAFGLAAMVLGGCGQGKDPWLAKVGKETITVSEYRDAYLVLKPAERPALDTIEEKKKFLDDLVSKEVMESLALEKYPDLTERQQWRLQRFKEKELSDAVRHRLIRSAIVVTPEMKDWLYEHMKEERNLNAMLIPDPDAAKWVRDQLDQRGDFGALARDHSIQWVGEDKHGDLGWKKPGGLFPYPVEVEVWNAEKGSRLGPITRPLGSYIVEVLDVRPVEIPPAQTREAMDRVLEEKLMEQLYIERQKEVQDSLRAAAEPYYSAEAKALLNMKYYVEPPADAALKPGTWFLDMDRVVPTFSAAEDTVIAVDFKNAPDWTVKEYAERLSWYPAGLWPRGDSEDQLVEALDLVVRDYLYLKAAQDLGYENAEFQKKLENMKREMRVTYFYYNDVVAKFTPDQAAIDAYFEANRNAYEAPKSYKLAFFGSRNKELIDKVAADWKSGASFSDVRTKYEKADPSLLAIGETEWLYTGQDVVRDQMVETLSEGQITNPTVRTDIAMVFQLIARREPRLLTYSEIKTQVDEDAKNTIVDQKLNELLQEQRAELGVKFNEGPLKKLEIPRDAPGVAGRTGPAGRVMKTPLKTGGETPAKSAPEGP